MSTRRHCGEASLETGTCDDGAQTMPNCPVANRIALAMEEDVPDWFRRDNRGTPLQERGDSRTETAHQDRWQAQIEELVCKLQPYVEHEGLGGVMRSPKILLARTFSARPLTLFAWPTLALLM